MALPALAAAEQLAADGVNAAAVNVRFLKPLDEAMLSEVVQSCRLIVTVEEGTIVNGFGAMLARRLQEFHPEVRILSMGVADTLMVQAPRAEQLASQGLTAHGIVARVRAAMPVSSTG
jgi:1-deoxy-D-xylulose-5-phosphate synthase